MQLPARYERPSLLVELACKQRIATGEELSGSLGEPHAGIGFHSRHKSLAGQVRELAFLFFAPALHKQHVQRSRPGVCPKQL